MLAFGTHFRLGRILAFLGSGQSVVARSLLMSEVLRIGRGGADRLTLPAIGAVSPHPVFRPVQEVRQDLRVVHVRGRRDHRVDELQFAVDADMRLHPKYHWFPFFA